MVTQSLGSIGFCRSGCRCSGGLSLLFIVIVRSNVFVKVAFIVTAMCAKVAGERFLSSVGQHMPFDVA